MDFAFEEHRYIVLDDHLTLTVEVRFEVTISPFSHFEGHMAMISPHMMGKSTSNQQLYEVEYAKDFTDQPSLEEVLRNEAPYPYTLDSFTTHMSQANCVEILNFILEVRRYREGYSAIFPDGESPASPDQLETWGLYEIWKCLLSMYIIPGSPQEINSISDKRNDLLAHCSPQKLPVPKMLDVVEQEMLDLISESIFPSFVTNSALGNTTWSRILYGNLTGCVSPMATLPCIGQGETTSRSHHIVTVTNTDPGAVFGTSSCASLFDDPSSTIDQQVAEETGNNVMRKIRAMLGFQGKKKKISGR